MKKNWKHEIIATALITLLALSFIYFTWWKILIVLATIIIIGIAFIVWIFWEVLKMWGNGDDEDYYNEELAALNKEPSREGT